MDQVETKVCASCKRTYNIDVFTTKQNKKSNNCLHCRIKYIEEKEKKNGRRYCNKCKRLMPLGEFYKEYNGTKTEFYSCKECRVKWFNDARK